MKNHAPLKNERISWNVYKTCSISSTKRKYVVTLRWKFLSYVANVSIVRSPYKSLVRIYVKWWLNCKKLTNNRILTTLTQTWLHFSTFFSTKVTICVCFLKKFFRSILQSSNENACDGVSLSLKVQTGRPQLYWMRVSSTDVFLQLFDFFPVKFCLK